MAVIWMTTAVLSLSLVSLVQAQGIANGVVKCHVVCNNNFVYTSDDPTFRLDDVDCGECRRAVWNGEQAAPLKGLEKGFPIARPPRAGWKVCVRAVPTQFTRASVDFLDDKGRLFVSHFDIRMAGKPYDHSFGETVVINEAVMGMNGEYDWAEQDTYHPVPYPFSVGEEFSLTIEATTEHLLTYYVDGLELATRRLQNSVRKATRVVVQGSVSIVSVNVWCD